jgi:SAM-dependent methyltransferase
VTARYDQIGAGYGATRREDPALQRLIEAALGEARSVVNVGAGAGSYEPAARQVIAVEPSRTMIAQRRQRSPHVLQAKAHALPLAEQSVDAAMVVLSLHHWDEGQEQGVRELRRVARGPIVIATIDAEVSGDMWLMADYLHEVAELDRRIFPPPERIAAWLGGRSELSVVEVPRDTPDWTLLSFWAHPERVLHAGARQATSGFARMPLAVVERVVHDVTRDLDSGAWDARHGRLRSLASFDAGLRLIVNRP